jgi:ribosomal protein S18 acetylase RimI-like enzyme
MPSSERDVEGAWRRDGRPTEIARRDLTGSSGIGDHGRVVSLEPMSADAWEAWRVASIRSYAAEKVAAGTWPGEGAEGRAVAEFRELLPQGQATPGHEFRSIVADGGEPVGIIWLAPQREIGRGAAFIYDIVIDESRRGRGYGRAAMEALEPLVRSLGYDRIALHVFGHNTIARNLYRALGYLETDVSMEKRLG